MERWRAEWTVETDSSGVKVRTGTHIFDRAADLRWQVTTRSGEAKGWWWWRWCAVSWNQRRITHVCCLPYRTLAGRNGCFYRAIFSFWVDGIAPPDFQMAVGTKIYALMYEIPHFLHVVPCQIGELDSPSREAKPYEEVIAPQSMQGNLDLQFVRSTVRSSTSIRATCPTIN